MPLRLGEEVQALLPLTAAWANDLNLLSFVNGLKPQLRSTKPLSLVRFWPIAAPRKG